MPLLNNKKVIVLLDQAVFSGTSFLITVLVARLLSLEAFGEYSGYILGIYLVVSTISAFVIQPFQVSFAKMFNKKAYYTVVFWLQIILVLCVLIVVFVLIYYFFNKTPLAIIPFAAGFIFQDFGRKFLMAINKPLHTLIFDVISAIGLGVFLFLFSIQSIQNTATLLSFLSLAYSLPFLLFVGYIKPATFDGFTIKKALLFHYKDGKWLFFTALVQWWSGNLFVVAAGIYLGAAALGALRLAQSVMGVLNVVLQIFENYILPQTAGILNTSYKKGIEYLANITKKAGLLFLLILVIVFVFSEQIIVLAGGIAYKPFAFVLNAMVLLYVFIYISQPLRIMCRVLLLNKQFFYGYLFSLLFSVLFSKILLSQFQLTGAIIGLISSQIILIIYWSLILQKRNIPLWKLFTSY